MDINKNTNLNELVKKYSGVKDFLAKLSPLFKLLGGPIGNLFFKNLTVGKASEKANIDVNEIIGKIKEIIAQAK